MTLLVFIIQMILFSLWNVAAINRYKKPKTDWFHIIGFMVKLPPLILLYPNILFILIYLNIVWTIYDLIISKGISGKWFLVGTTSKIDKFLGKFKFYIQGLLLLGTILYAIIS